MDLFHPYKEPYKLVKLGLQPLGVVGDPTEKKTGDIWWLGQPTL